MIIIIICINDCSVRLHERKPTMSYHINAWLEDGDPRLEIVDAHSKSVCMSWSYKSRAGLESRDKNEIQRLFRKLILLTCRETIANCRIFETRPNLKDREEI
jgi:hypothetical protein